LTLVITATYTFDNALPSGDAFLFVVGRSVGREFIDGRDMSLMQTERAAVARCGYSLAASQRGSIRTDVERSG